MNPPPSDPREMEPVEPLAPDLAALLSTERREANLAPALRSQLRDRLQVSLPLAWPAGARPRPTGLSGGRAASAAGALARRVLPVVVAFGVGVGAGVAVRGRPTAIPPSPPAPSVAPLAPGPTLVMPAPPPALPPQPLPPHPPPTTAKHPSALPAARPVPTDADLARESALIEEARNALARGQPGNALAALSAHAQGFPNGRLIEERQALRVDALVRAGRITEAQAAAAAFAQTFPNSILQPAVEASLRAASKAAP